MYHPNRGHSASQGGHTPSHRQRVGQGTSKSCAIHAPTNSRDSASNLQPYPSPPSRSALSQKDASSRAIRDRGQTKTLATRCETRTLSNHRRSEIYKSMRMYSSMLPTEASGTQGSKCTNSLHGAIDQRSQHGKTTSREMRLAGKE